MNVIKWLNQPATQTGSWYFINTNKNIILAIFFGIISGIREHSVIWGLFITVLGFALFCLMDWMRAPLGEGPLDRFVGIRKR